MRQSANRKPMPRIIWAILAAGILLRILFPLADPPPGLTISGAPVGDPGQHSYGARNRVMFGQWSFDDWQPHLGSPLISTALNLLTYQWLGIRFSTHKAIPIFFSILSFLAFFCLLRRRLPPRVVTAASLFAAMSFPLLMYARTANRYMPMICFFILSLHWFIRGAEKGRRRDFFFAAIFFLLAYASQNHILYMAGFYAALGAFWLIRHRLRWTNLAVFWGTTAAGLTAWYLLVFFPHRDFFSHFVAHNQLVRRIHSLSSLLANVADNPFALQFRHDALLLLLTSLGVGVAAALWIRRGRLPLIIEAGVFWLASCAGFHAIWSYRPTRFYLLPIFAAAMIGAWWLHRMVERQRFTHRAWEWAAAAAGTAAGLLLVGGIRYGPSLLRFVKSSLSAAITLAIISTLLLLLTFAARPTRRWAALGILIIAAAINLSRFTHWAIHREYRIVRTADVLTRALPPTVIAGNWASVLSIGGPHRTHLLSGEMGINWRAGFLENHGVQYLLLTRGHFADEYREYMRLFPRQLRHARLAANFPIYTANVQLWELDPAPGKKGTAEMESLTRRPGHVEFDPQASKKMALSLPAGRDCRIQYPPEAALNSGDHLELRARGHFRMHIELKSAGVTLRRNLVVWDSREYSTRRILTGPIPENATVELRLVCRDRAARLDKISTSASN